VPVKIAPGHIPGHEGLPFAVPRVFQPARYDLPVMVQNQQATRRRRATIHTLGCRLNQTESNLIRQGLEAAGYEIVPFSAPADLAIINTCTVTSLADAKSRQAIRGFIRRNPNAFTAVIGCYSQHGVREIARIPGVDLILGNQDKLQVLDFVREGKCHPPVIIRDRISREDFSISFVGDTPFNRRANLKIQDGCDFVCSFCIIPSVRGAARSRDLKNLLDEARSLVARGVREIVLTGVNIGTYQSGGATLVDMIDALAGIAGLERIRVSSIEPTTVPVALFARMADPAHPLTPFLHLPLQSGCDRILREMRRRYTVAEYLAFLDQAVARVPGLYVGTDIMVGFPGETEAEFEETCRVFVEGPFHFAHVFPYSERDRTLAARRGDQVPERERARRSARLRRLAASKKHDFYAAHIGQEMSVLIEDPKPGLWTGYTENYVRVVIDRQHESGGPDLTNRIVPVRIEAVEADFATGRLAGEPR